MRSPPPPPAQNMRIGLKNKANTKRGADGQISGGRLKRIGIAVFEMLLA